MQVLSGLLIIYCYSTYPCFRYMILFENKVDGIDSVKVSFDADIQNERLYGKEKIFIYRWIDIILSREIMDTMVILKVKRYLPVLIRGGFTSLDGIEYSRNNHIHT